MDSPEISGTSLGDRVKPAPVFQRKGLGPERRVDIGGSEQRFGLGFRDAQAAAQAAAEHLAALPETGFDLEAHVQKIEREYIAEALKKAGGVQVRAAELLGMSFRSFRYYVKKYNLR